MKFIKEMNTRNGQASSKKFWYNTAGLTSTIIILWVTYKDTMEDYAFILLFLAYLLTVGGFEVILKMTQLIIDFKAGRSSTTTSTTTNTKETNNANPIPPVP